MDAYQPTVADSFWDLRDDACDHPERWRNVTAEAVFQRLAELVEQAEANGGSINWRRDVTEPMLTSPTSSGLLTSTFSHVEPELHHVAAAINL